MVRASSLVRMIGCPGLAHFIFGCPLSPGLFTGFLLDGVRSTEFCHCSGRPICNSYRSIFHLPHPARKPQCPRHDTTLPTSKTGRGRDHQPGPPGSLLTGQRGADDISVVGFALGHVGGPLGEEVHLLSFARARCLSDCPAMKMAPMAQARNDNRPQTPGQHLDRSQWLPSDPASPGFPSRGVPSGSRRRWSMSIGPSTLTDKPGSPCRSTARGTPTIAPTKTKTSRSARWDHGYPGGLPRWHAFFSKRFGSWRPPSLPPYMS
ncbi:hypothetical protein B0T18DRAFT_411253 [Schizothecium vesticola]|uniref:Uncharacterized protein n=1 Tax=Schizothecium vesticola TaxID=314040 RepID=A0AA40EVL0_9PEZI|nr:hypothetical protein B0T18DRAFT_411253 [Schizothecium vesticola]